MQVPFPCSAAVAAAATTPADLTARYFLARTPLVAAALVAILGLLAVPSKTFAQTGGTATPPVTGAVLGWGSNSTGNLGDGTSGSNRLTPVATKDLAGAAFNDTIGVAAGTAHSLAVRSNGTVWSWGSNGTGQLGDGTFTIRLNPVQVKDAGGVPLSGFASVAAGSSHSVAVKADGTVWAWGSNGSGQVGDGTIGNNRVFAVPVLGLQGVTTVAAGGTHSLALKADGTVWAWGSNGSGQIGDNTFTAHSMPVPVKDSQGIPLSGIIAIAAGGSHSLAVKNNGTVLSWGSNSTGQIGDNSTGVSRPAAVLVKDGAGAPLLGFLKVAAGGTHSLAMRSDGSVWAWGNDAGGQLGDGTIGGSRIFAAPVPDLAGVASVAAGTNHSVAVKRNGTALTWGANGNGQLGDGTIPVSRALPAPVKDASGSPVAGIVAASAGSTFNLALQSDSPAWVWGSNGNGQLGDGVVVSSRSFAAPLQNVHDIVSAATGYYHTLALRSDGTILAWGANSFGQLGDGTYTGRRIAQPVREASGAPFGRVVAVAAGYVYSLALRDDGTVWAWGDNAGGKLGDGTTSSRNAPVPVRDTSGPPLTGIKAIASGGDRGILALKTDGTVWAWGWNTPTPVLVRDSAGVPLSDVVRIASGGFGSLAVKADGTVRAWFGTTLFNSTPVQDASGAALSGVVSVSVGYSQSLVVTGDGMVWAWGQNNFGQLGIGTIDSSPHPVAQPVQDAAGDTLSGVIAVASGGFSNFAVKGDGTVWAWGDNNTGQLGDGTSGAPRPYAAPVEDVFGSPLSGFGSVAASAFHSVALKKNNAPVAEDDTYRLSEDTPLRVSALQGVLANDSDPDTIYSLRAILVTGPTNGQLILKPDGSFDYTPAANFFGSDSFTYRVTDGTNTSNVATVTLPVSSVLDPAVAMGQSVTTMEDTPADIILTASNPDARTVRYSNVQPLHGTLSGFTPNLTYTPNANYHGPDSFTFTVITFNNDQSTSTSQATVSITVTPINDVPVADSQAVTTAEDTPTTITLFGADVDGDSLTYTVVSGPGHGTLSGSGATLTYTPRDNFHGSDTVTFKVDDSTDDSSIATVNITVSAVNDAPTANALAITTAEDTAATVTLTGGDVDGNALTYTLVSGPSHGTLGGNGANRTYTPAANFQGSDSFTYKTNDGTADSAVATVVISVTPVNDPPVAGDDSSASTPVNTAVTIAVLANDKDADGDSLTLTGVTQPTNGTVIVSADGKSLIYTPRKGFSGTDTLTYTVSDGSLSDTALVSVTVTAPSKPGKPSKPGR